MNTKGKERITLMLITIAKEVREYLLSEENQDHPFYRSESFLVSSFDEEREVESLRREVASLGISYPVVTDNDYQTCNAYHVESLANHLSVR